MATDTIEPVTKVGQCNHLSIRQLVMRDIALDRVYESLSPAWNTHTKVERLLICGNLFTDELESHLTRTTNDDGRLWLINRECCQDYWKQGVP